MNRLSIVIVNYNGIEFLPACVKSIYDTVTAAFEIIIVDNNSGDGSARVIKALFPRAEVIEEAMNLGFSKAGNIGFRKSTGEYLLFLNPDTALQPGAVDGMLKFSEAHPEIGILGPKILDCRLRITRDGKRRAVNLIDDLLMLFLIDKISDAVMMFFSILPRKSGACGRVSGSCMLMSRVTFESLGGFDESLPMFLDDIDICERSIRSGRINYYLAEAAVIHKKQMSIKSSGNYKMFDLLSLKAHCFYYRKHFGEGRVFIFKLMTALSIPYLLLLDAAAFPFFLTAKKINAWRRILAKHLGYLYVITESDIEGRFLGFEKGARGESTPGK